MMRVNYGSSHGLRPVWQVEHVRLPAAAPDSSSGRGLRCTGIYKTKRRTVHKHTANPITATAMENLLGGLVGSDGVAKIIGDKVGEYRL